MKWDRNFVEIRFKYGEGLGEIINYRRRSVRLRR